jgi:AraC-like DNA-binding protein
MLQKEGSILKLIDHFILNKTPFLFNYKYCTNDPEFNMFHSHQGIEFLYIYEGSGHIVVEQELHPIVPHMLICFQPFQFHHIHVPDASNYIRSMFLIDPVFAKHYFRPFPNIESIFLQMWKGQPLQQIFTLQGDHTISELYSMLNMRLKTLPSKHHNEEVVLFLFSILQHLQLITSPAPSPRRIRRHSELIMEWVDLHYKEAFFLDKLAEELHLSPYHISHLFPEDTGFTITEYVMARRLREACYLLSNTNLSMQYICQEIGLSSASYFTQMFKKHMGVTPKKYREKSAEV